MPTPPPFPFSRSGRVVYSARGLYGFAALMLVAATGFTLLMIDYADQNSTTAIVVGFVFVSFLVCGAIWCVYCARRVRRWEREYERVMGRPPER